VSRPVEPAPQRSRASTGVLEPILAIGGSASVGKTTSATALARRRGLSLVHVDDLRRGVVDASFVDTTPDVWYLPVDRLTAMLRAETACLAPAVVAAVDGLRAAGSGGVIEGEGVEPALMARSPSDDLRPVFLVESDPDRLHDTFAARPSRDRYLALDPDERRAVVEMNLRYGDWLRAEADRFGFSWLAPHPWSTLADRMLAAARCQWSRSRGSD
jgi:hypothetical protein